MPGKDMQAGRRQAIPAAPRYRTVAETLRRDIAAGVPAVGEMLPTEDELCRTFGVSRHTIRIALDELKADGLIRSRQGAGSRVIRRVPQGHYTVTVSSLEELIQHTTEIRYTVTRFAFVVADAKLAERLDCRAGERWLRTEGLSTMGSGGEPICWTEVFVHPDYVGIAPMLSGRDGPISAVIEAMYQVVVGEVHQALRVTAMPRETAALLASEPGGMAIEISRFYRLSDGRMAQVAVNLHPAERFRYELTLRRQRS